MPVIGVAGTSGLYISSPVGEDNFAVRLMNLKHESGEPVYRTFHICIICDDCKLLPRSQAVNCHHMDNVLPPWKSREQHKVNNVIYKALNSVGASLRENSGGGRVHTSIPLFLCESRSL